VTQGSDATEVTPQMRAAIMGTQDYLGLPFNIWDIIGGWNRQKGAQARRDLMVSVEFAPLLKVIYEAARQQEVPDV